MSDSFDARQRAEISSVLSDDWSVHEAIAFSPSSRSRELSLRDIWPWIRDEAVAIRHLHSGQGGSVHDGIFGNDLILVEQPGDDGIDFVRRQGLRRREGHRPAN